jgi:ferrous iron transport protein A
MTKKPLTEYPVGSIVRVADIHGGRKARSRMLALGMTPGCPVVILSEGPTGCRVRVRGAEIVLCCGLAGKILAVENNSNEIPHCNCCPNTTRAKIS